METSLLVVGARPRSLGAAVVDEAHDAGAGIKVVTAGRTGHEDHTLDITNVESTHRFLKDHGPFQHVVCTAGVNLPGTIQGKGWLANMHKQMEVNYGGPMILLSEWARIWRDQGLVQGDVKHFVAISSNSAHVARSNSGGYCASKAALSMGIRCAAREMATWPFSIYAYEPGWIDGTPMSEATRSRLGSQSAHRIPSGEGIDALALAYMIVNNILHTRKELSGCTIRVDGGEQ